MKILTAILPLLTLIRETYQSYKQPNIIVIVADDLGYNDVSWHNKEMLTPNLGHLAHNGVILEQSYVQPICSPTRSALMTGRYPIHTGRQHSVIKPQEPRGLFTNMTLLPQHLKELGYSTHMIGKWHLGFCNSSYLPTRRGFDTYSGYYTGSQDYYKHTRMSATKPRTLGYDFRNNEDVDNDVVGKYSANVFADKAVKIIRDQAGKTKPMFLYLAFQSVHAPLQVPEEYERPYLNIKNDARRTYSGMVLALDEAVGNITKALNESGLAKNTLIIFTTDNGGQTLNGGNNFPLRGNKNTLWEGGTRGCAFIHGSMLKNPGRISYGLIHVTDWLPTLVTLAGGDSKRLIGIDGIDQWRALMMDKKSPRKNMLYNIDPFKDGGNGAVRLGNYKLIRGDPGRPDGWIPAPAVANIENEEYFDHLQDIFKSSHCLGKSKGTKLLFHLFDDPFEKHDVSGKFPEIVKMLESKLDEYAVRMIPPDETDLVAEGNPANFENIWSAGWCVARP